MALIVSREKSPLTHPLYAELLLSSIVQCIENLVAYGNPNVTANHSSTLEITTDSYLTPSGDCIVGISSNRSPATFSNDFITACQTKNAKITVKLSVGRYEQYISGRGHPDLTFKSTNSAVIRTSGYVDDRTIMINSDTAAKNLNRNIISLLQNESKIHLRLTVL
ncbi:MAG: DUF371 domain-containing protein [Halobacteriales archaeon]|tara:strand:- start:160 stop:654 length:495 start_codon:yes stop_codon:yes gene_type:complete